MDAETCHAMILNNPVQSRSTSCEGSAGTQSLLGRADSDSDGDVTPRCTPLRVAGFGDRQVAPRASFRHQP